ncbi:MAG: thiamine phosphate synthase [Rhizomicrobium sp.]
MADKRARAELARAAFALNARSSLPPLVLMTDEARLADPAASVCALPRGSMVILRARDEKRRGDLAIELRAITRARRIKLLIANDAELAARVGADGIHLAEALASTAVHWRACRPDWIITAAAHSLPALRLAQVDALILAPVFPTRSHPGAKHIGAIRARILAQQSRTPLYALGGVDAATARQLAGARFAGLAAIGALTV